MTTMLESHKDDVEGYLAEYPDRAADEKQWEGSVTLPGGIVVIIQVTAPEGDPRIERCKRLQQLLLEVAP